MPAQHQCEAHAHYKYANRGFSETGDDTMGGHQAKEAQELKRQRRVAAEREQRAQVCLVSKNCDMAHLHLLTSLAYDLWHCF